MTAWLSCESCAHNMMLAVLMHIRQWTNANDLFHRAFTSTHPQLRPLGSCGPPQPGCVGLAATVPHLCANRVVMFLEKRSSNNQNGEDSSGMLTQPKLLDPPGLDILSHPADWPRMNKLNIELWRQDKSQQLPGLQHMQLLWQLLLLSNIAGWRQRSTPTAHMPVLKKSI